jgi:hypothetical protein
MDSFDSVIASAYRSAVVGKLSAALSSISFIRSRWKIESKPRDAIEVMLVEGVVHIYAGRISDGIDRFRRVIAIGDVVREGNLASLGRGWYALVLYNEGKVLEASEILARSLGEVEAMQPRTILRVSTVQGLLCEYAGFGQAAIEWLNAARIAAQRVAIPGVMSSIIYDMAVAAIDSAAFRKLSGRLEDSQARQLLLRVRSAINYDIGSGTRIQSGLHILALGMTLNICGEYAEAERHLLRYLQMMPDSRLADRVCASVELAIAQVGSGASQLDPTVVRAIEEGLSILTEPTERALALNVLAKNLERSGLIDESLLRRSAMQSEIVRREQMSLALRASIETNSMMFPPRQWIN